MADRRTSDWKFPSRVSFGPGSMERLHLTRWTDRHRNVKIRLQGIYPIYCGEGNVHWLDVDERDHLSHLVTDHDIFEVEDLAQALLNWATDAYDGCGCSIDPFDPEEDTRTVYRVAVSRGGQVLKDETLDRLIEADADFCAPFVYNAEDLARYWASTLADMLGKGYTVTVTPEEWN